MQSGELIRFDVDFLTSEKEKNFSTRLIFVSDVLFLLLSIGKKFFVLQKIYSMYFMLPYFHIWYVPDVKQAAWSCEF